MSKKYYTLFEGHRITGQVHDLFRMSRERRIRLTLMSAFDSKSPSNCCSHSSSRSKSITDFGHCIKAARGSTYKVFHAISYAHLSLMANRQNDQARQIQCSYISASIMLLHHNCLLPSIQIQLMMSQSSARRCKAAAYTRINQLISRICCWYEHLR
jgi:hypothetical protein